MLKTDSSTASVLMPSRSLLVGQNGNRGLNYSRNLRKPLIKELFKSIGNPGFFTRPDEIFSESKRDTNEVLMDTNFACCRDDVKRDAPLHS